MVTFLILKRSIKKKQNYMKNIEEINNHIIRSQFGFRTETSVSYEIDKPRVNHKLLADVKEHRMINGLTSKFTILRNFLKTRKFVKTTYCN